MAVQYACVFAQLFLYYVKKNRGILCQKNYTNLVNYCIIISKDNDGAG